MSKANPEPTPSRSKLNAKRLPAVIMCMTITAAAALLLLLTIPGCQGMILSRTGDTMNSFALEHMVPDMMASDDLSMACETGVSMASVLMSFGRVADPPRKAAVVTLLSAGMCAEEEAWESDLRQVRAVRDGNSSEARDARIAMQRSHGLAAERFHTAYQQLEEEFGPPGEECPALRDEDEVIYLLGLSAGLLALVHDRAAEGLAGVPMALPRAIARAADCLDEESWWGAPTALKAAVWASVPGAAPEDVDPFETLAGAARMGEESGVRLARAFEVQSLSTAGREDALRDAVSDHADSLESIEPNPEWRLLDEYATRMILHVSDRSWTQDRGHRTPLGELGTFWQEPEEVEGDDDLFDDIFDDDDELFDDDDDVSDEPEDDNNDQESTE